MGQRTQLLVLKEDNKGNKEARFYHHQWGFGRVMYLALMDMCIGYYDKGFSVREGFNFFDAIKFSCNSKIIDITNNVPKHVMDAVNPDDFKTIQEVFDYGDNNNGGLFIYVKQAEKVYQPSTFKIGFLLGCEDEETIESDGVVINKGNGKAFERWLTPQEYGKLNGGRNYSDDEFVDMFDKFCKYFKIEYFKNKEE